jgi:hypothetical protein
MINPTDIVFDVGIYTGLTLQGVTDLVYEKLGEYDPNADGPLWDEYNNLTDDHIFLEGGWEVKVSIREKIIQKALEIVELVDGVRNSDPIIKEKFTEIEPVNIDSIPTSPIDSINSELEIDTNVGSEVIETSTTPTDVIEQPTEESGKEEKDVNVSDFNPIQLTQITKPTIKPTPITFDVGNMPEKDKKQFKVGLGQVPLIYYNGVHIEYNRIENFSLYHEGILPACKMSFTDQASFRDIGFPTDDISITIYIYSRSKLIRPIYMDFKVTNMRDTGGLITITGIANIPQIYISKFESFNSKTSLETMKEVSKICNLGFNTNINSTNDKQTWINPGYKRKDFIESICENAYISDTSFVVCYIDFYYNLCYMDLEKEIERDISNDKMRLSTGKSEMTDDESNEENIIPLLLTTDNSALDTNCYVSGVDILNRSTRVSLNRAYITRTKFYDDISKEILIFDIDSINDDKNKLCLKGKLNDTEFYNSNANNIWMGKIDKFEDGDGNSHDNYNYSSVHNKINKSELTKIDIDIILPVPNYNFYLFQKIRFELIYDVLGALSSSSSHERISGEAIINSLEFIFDGIRYYQKIGLIRRDLEKTEEEIENTNTRSVFNEEFQNNENPLGPADVNNSLPNSGDVIENSTVDNKPKVNNISGDDPDFWTLVAVASREDSDSQSRADIAQSIYNRVSAPLYPNSIKSVITQDWAYEPTWKHPRQSTVLGKPNSEWFSITNADTAATAAGWVTTDEVLLTARAILDTTLQSRARDFVQGRTDFLSETQGTPEVRNSKKPTSMAVMRTENRPNNVFAWNYNYTDNIVQATPNWESLGIVPESLA